LKGHCLHQLSFQRFHVLFDSLFRVLFIFPSRYVVRYRSFCCLFSFGWNIPPRQNIKEINFPHILWLIRAAFSNNPTLGNKIKVITPVRETKHGTAMNGAVTLHGTFFQRDLAVLIRQSHIVFIKK